MVSQRIFWGVDKERGIITLRMCFCVSGVAAYVMGMFLSFFRKPSNEGVALMNEAILKRIEMKRLLEEAFEQVQPSTVQLAARPHLLSQKITSDSTRLDPTVAVRTHEVHYVGNQTETIAGHKSQAIAINFTASDLSLGALYNNKQSQQSGETVGLAPLRLLLEPIPVGKHSSNQTELSPRASYNNEESQQSGMTVGLAPPRPPLEQVPVRKLLSNPTGLRKRRNIENDEFENARGKTKRGKTKEGRHKSNDLAA
jgi:hypothetical protein